MDKWPSKSDWYIIALFFFIGTIVTYTMEMEDGVSCFHMIWDTFVYIIATFAVSYLIVYRLFPKYFPEKKIIVLFICVLLVMILIGIAEMIAYRIFRPDRSWLELFTYIQLPIYAIAGSAQNSGILVGILLGKKFYDAQIELEKRNREKRESELRLLKSQVDPHFLFNNLNTVDSLIDKDPKLAKEYLSNLSKLYRYLIQTKDDEVVEVKEELEFSKNYIFLIEKRFGNAYEFEIQTNGYSSDKLIPPSSIQAAIENVVKHNSAPAGSQILTTIEVLDNKVIISNNLNRKNVNQQSTGTGLLNLKKRYSFLTDEEIVIKQDKDFVIELPLIKIVD